MANDVRSTGRTSNVTGSSDTSLASLLDALKSGDTEAALSAVGTLLRGRGGNVTGSPKDKGFGAQLKNVFNDVKDRLTGPERKAVTEALAKTETKAATTTDETSEPRNTADANTMGAARRHALVAERARRTAVEQRVDVENMAGYVGQWNPKVAEAAVEKLDTAQAALEVERQNVNGAMTEIRRDIKALEGKGSRSEAEDLLLEGKRGQLEAFDGLGQVLDARIDQMKRAKGALKHDNFENEIGKNEVSLEEARLLAQQGNAIDEATGGVVEAGRLADSNVLRASKLLEKEGGFKPEAATTEKPDATTTEKKKTETASVVDTKNPLPKAEVDKAVSNIALGVGTDKTKINSASAIFKELEGKSPEQIAQIKTAYNEKYAKAGKDANGSWEGGWDFDKNVRGNMHTWNKQAFDALAAGKPEAKQLIADGAKKDQEVNAGKIKADFTEPKVDTTKVEDKKLLSKDELDKTVSAVAMGVGTDKTKIHSASAIFGALEGKTPEQIAQIKTAYNEKYGKAGKDANGSWEGGWDFDKNVRGNMHTWNKQAFDALAAGKPEAKQLIADGAKKDQEVNAGKIKADFAEPTVAKPTVTVKEGDWLSRIAANAKNKDGSPVTLEQLRAQPENKYIFDRNDKGDLIRPGDKVTLPDGSTHPAAELAGATPETKPETKTAPGKVKTGLKKTEPETKPEVKPADVKPEAKPEVKPADVTYAQLSEKQVNDAVGAIASGVGATKGEMKSSGAVFDAVNGMSPNQLAQVKEAYNKKFGAQGWDFDKHVKGAMYPWNQKAFEALEKGDTKGATQLREAGKKLDAQVAADTKKLRDAVEGGGTDEKAIFDTLKKHQNNPEMLRAIESQYKRDYKEDLRSRVDAEMKGGDFGEFRNTNDDAIRAKALFDGKPNVASAALLHSLLADGSSNAEVALQVMTKEITPERRKAVADEFKKLYGKTPEQMVREWPMWDGNVKADLIIAARDMSR